MKRLYQFMLLMVLIGFSQSISGQTTNVFPSDGNVGVGTLTPIEKLSILGNVIWDGYNSGNPRALKIGYSGGNYGGIGYNMNFTGSTGIFNRPLADNSSYLEFWHGGFKFYGIDNANTAQGIDLGGSGNNLNLFATITNTGNFGIGTSDPKGHKLAVNGKIRAQEIKVENTNWPDFVSTGNRKSY